MSKVARSISACNRVMLSDCGGFGRGLEGIGEEAGGDGVWGMGDGGWGMGEGGLRGWRMKGII